MKKISKNIKNQKQIYSVLLITNKKQKTALKEFCKRNNLDFKNIRYINNEDEAVSIEHVRKLINQSFSNSKFEQIFVLFNFDKASIPAQNSSLKILEEHPKNTKIILLSNTQNILDTVKSRCLITFIKKTSKTKDNKQELQDFYENINTYEKCIKLADKYKQKHKAISFINFLIELIYKNEYNLKIRIETLKYLNKTLFLLDKNINIKLSLENCFFKIKNTVYKE